MHKMCKNAARLKCDELSRARAGAITLYSLRKAKASLHRVYEI